MSEGKVENGATDPSVMQMMTDNMTAKFAMLAKGLPGVSARWLGMIQYVDCGMQSDTFNTVIGPPSGADDVDEVTRHFQDRNRPAAWWLAGSSDQAGRDLQRGGWSYEEYDVGMYLELSGASLAPDALSAHSRVEYCDSPGRFQDFGQVLSSVFEPDNPLEAETVRAVYRLAGQHHAELPENLTQLVGYADDQPVSAATVYFTGDVAGVFDIATPARLRNRGLGTEIFQRAVRVAHQRGASACVLQASPDGLGIYKRQGFVASGEFEVWSLPCRQ